MPSELGVTVVMPDRLVKRGEEPSVETEDSADMIRFLAFVNVDIHSVTFLVP
jgi:hypothetical protein